MDLKCDGFQELSQDEMMQTEGGLVGLIIGAVVLVAALLWAQEAN